MQHLILKVRYFSIFVVEYFDIFFSFRVNWKRDREVILGRGPTIIKANINLHHRWTLKWPFENPSVTRAHELNTSNYSMYQGRSYYYTKSYCQSVQGSMWTLLKLEWPLRNPLLTSLTIFLCAFPIIINHNIWTTGNVHTDP